MKPMICRNLVAVAFLISIVGLSIPVSASPIITAVEKDENVSTIPVVAAHEQDGYDFFQVQPAPSGTVTANLGTIPNYVTLTTNTAAVSSSTLDTTLTIGGTDYKTGIVYNHGSQGSNDATYGDLVATLTFRATTTFDVGVLVDNFTGPNLTTAVSVTTMGAGTGVTQTAKNLFENDFYFFQVSGSVNDQVEIRVVRSGDNSILGGLVFDTVPEPASLTLLGAGGLVLLKRRRA